MKDRFVPPLVLTGLRSLRVSHPHRNSSQEILTEPVAPQSPDGSNDVIESHRRVRGAGSPHEVRQIPNDILGHGHDGFRVIARSKEVYLQPSDGIHVDLPGRTSATRPLSC